MPRATRQSAASPRVASTPESPAWLQWPLKMQALQYNAAQDMLGVFSRHVAALVAARDVQAIGAAQEAAVSDWAACFDDIQRRGVELAALLLPAQSWNAIGWRLKPGAFASGDGAADEAPPDLFEQARLGMEMLLRPWMAAPDLEHTDEFVA